MTIKVAINGYGRIGRNILRAHYEGGKKHDIAIVAVNDLGSPETNAHLTRYDTAHGKFPGKVEVDGDALVVNGDRIKVLAQRDPAQLPWATLGVDVVLESTGFFTTKEKASAHLNGGAKKVIISAPGGKDVDATIVYGVNHKTLKGADTVISNASCSGLTSGARQLVVHDALETTVWLAFSVSWLTPYTMVPSTSLPPGAEMMTFFAPPARCAEAFSLVVKKPVHSITTSTPRSFQGSSAGLRMASTRILSPLTTM